MKAFKWWQLQDENISLQIKCKSLEDNVADNALGATVMLMWFLMCWKHVADLVNWKKQLNWQDP